MSGAFPHICYLLLMHFPVAYQKCFEKSVKYLYALVFPRFSCLQFLLETNREEIHLHNIFLTFIGTLMNNKKIIKSRSFGALPSCCYVNIRPAALKIMCSRMSGVLKMCEM